MAGSEQVNANAAQYRDRAIAAIKALCEHYAVRMENYAKVNKRWRTRTGHAQQSLFGYLYEEGPEIIKIRSAHGVEYGKWLELCNQGKYAILEESVDANANQFFRDLGWMVRRI